MDNTSSNGQCDWYQATGKQAFFITYHIITPIYFFLGILGHFLCIIAYYRQSKKEKSYMYQIFVTGSETIEISTSALSIVVAAWWSGRLAPGQFWFMSNYALLWCAAHVTVPL